VSPIGPRHAVLFESIMEVLSKVIDPETGIDLLKLGLVRDIQTNDGDVSLKLRPASSVCPVAFRLGALVKDAIFSVPGVKSLRIRVENFNRAEELESLLNQDSAKKEVG
jgi:metal-sulfur cluster biosynthetic enzyme